MKWRERVDILINVFDILIENRDNALIGTNNEIESVTVITRSEKRKKSEVEEEEWPEEKWKLPLPN